MNFKIPLQTNFIKLDFFHETAHHACKREKLVSATHGAEKRNNLGDDLA
jgi:hypothetical protein